MNPIEEKVPQQYRSGIVIFADGLCSRNGTQDAVMGGSYMVFNNGKQMRFSRKGEQSVHRELSFKNETIQTSPVAECLTLIDVLEYVQEVRQRASTQPHITVCMDNAMAVGFANQTQKAHEPHTKILRDRIVNHPARDENLTVVWVPRKVIATILGH
jgi:ribonuclease HI